MDKWLLKNIGDKYYMESLRLRDTMNTKKHKDHHGV